MVLEQLENPNRQIQRNLLEMMKDILIHRLKLHSKDNDTDIAPKCKPEICAKILYCNKGMDKIRISKIIHESMHTVPDFFKYKEAPCVLYTRTKCIRSDILNYYQTISDIEMDEWKNKSLFM